MAAITLFASFIILLLLGVPVAFTLALSTLLALLVSDNLSVMVAIQQMASSVNSFSLLAIPLFILTGHIMTIGGTGERLVNFANAIVGHFRGGLAHANVLSSMFFGAVSGAASADTAAIGGVMIPSMSKAGYSKKFATVITVVSSPIGIIIPPSIAMIIYSWLTGASVSTLFIAGIVPGIFVGLSLMIISYFISRKNNYGNVEKFSLSYLWKAFVDAFPVLLLPVIILGGIFMGVFTASESASVAVIYGLLISMYYYKTIKIRDLPKVFIDTCKTTSVVLILLATTGAFGWVMTREQVPLKLTEALLSITPSPLFFLYMVIIICLIVGLFIPPTAALVIVVPLLAPVAMNLDIDIIHFGLVVIVSLGIGHFTPPVGLCLYVGSSISKIPVSELVRPIIPFVLVMVGISLFIATFPTLFLWLPNLMQ